MKRNFSLLSRSSNCSSSFPLSLCSLRFAGAGFFRRPGKGQIPQHLNNARQLYRAGLVNVWMDNDGMIPRQSGQAADPPVTALTIHQYVKRAV